MLSNFGSHQILKSYGISLMAVPKSSTWTKYLRGSIKKWEWIEMVETLKDIEVGRNGNNAYKKLIS
jgi:hypothetical protein